MPSALAADYLCCNRPPASAGKTCIELGAGTGVVGISLARVGAARVVLTDGNGATVENCRHNLKLNGCWQEHKQNAVYSSTPQVQRLVCVVEPYWLCLLPSGCCCLKGVQVGLLVVQVVQVQQMCWEEQCPIHPDTILAADVLYDPGEMLA